MDALLYTKLVTILSALMLIWFALKVGGARGKHEIKAPSVSGPDEFNRVYRAHQNTVEMMVVFLPTLWVFSSLVNDLYAGILGIIWILGRVLYFFAYCKEASKRARGFLISFLALMVMIIWSLVNMVGLLI
ncbi:MAPEG family protein [Temperatibacter marinus]|uniref:MAPEG family protein n=1 Tax=Temperatibacter marinus TaxID=1456591 RepID=A0AA52H9V9_9PROT|nr:MAPEG family protein [Temperatibacter marinus]WND03324.1 MAPEG family protein [Temperatibacter marinus]